MYTQVRCFFIKNISKQFSLPCAIRNIDGMQISNTNDDAFQCSSDDALAKIIYHSIVGYSFNEYDLTLAELQEFI